MDLNGLIGMSRKYGGDPGFVLAGGGNTSYKEEGIMAVKASGSPLSVIDEAGFVLMEVEKLRALAADDYPDGDKEREERALMDMMAARLDGQGDKRPSVECILHALFRKSYVLHVHPALVNGLTCGKNGAAAAAELFEGAGDVFLWVPLTKPGYTLSRTCAKMFAGHAEAFGQYPSVALLQNHGIFVAGDTPEEVGLLMDEAVSRISKRVARRPDIEARSAGEEKAAIIALRDDLIANIENFTDDKSCATAIYQIAEDHGLQGKDLFRAAYQALIGKDQGPRLANFLRSISKERLLEILAVY